MFTAAKTILVDSKNQNALALLCLASGPLPICCKLTQASVKRCADRARSRTQQRREREKAKLLPLVSPGASFSVDIQIRAGMTTFVGTGKTVKCDLFVMVFRTESQVTYKVVMHQSIPAAPIPPPRETAGHLRALSVPGVGH